MRVRLLARLVGQEAGRERPYDAGCVYDVPQSLAADWIETGLAELVEEVVALAGAPENRALGLRASDRRRAR